MGFKKFRRKGSGGSFREKERFEGRLSNSRGEGIRGGTGCVEGMNWRAPEAESGYDEPREGDEMELDGEHETKKQRKERLRLQEQFCVLSVCLPHLILKFYFAESNFRLFVTLEASK